MYRSFFVSMLLLAVGNANGQNTLKFEYDAAGNRILREAKEPEEPIWTSILSPCVENTDSEKNVFRFTVTEINPDEVSQIEVFSSAGYKVLSPKFSGNDLTVDLSAVKQRGVYVIKCVYQGVTYSYSVLVK